MQVAIDSIMIVEINFVESREKKCADRQGSTSEL
jgi:hypothetical protein